MIHFFNHISILELVLDSFQLIFNPKLFHLFIQDLKFIFRFHFLFGFFIYFLLFFFFFYFLVNTKHSNRIWDGTGGLCIRIIIGCLLLGIGFNILIMFLKPSVGTVCHLFLRIFIVLRYGHEVFG